MSSDPFAWLDLPPGPQTVRETKRELSALEADITHIAPTRFDRFTQAEWDLFFTLREPSTPAAGDSYEDWPVDRHVLLYEAQEYDFP